MLSGASGVTKPGSTQDEKNEKYDYVDIDTVETTKNIFPLTDNYPDIPVIFIDGEFIGGYSELVTRKNPHYTPPPGISMFPGELHQGPAALYQQTISPSALTNPHHCPIESKPAELLPTLHSNTISGISNTTLTM